MPEPDSGAWVERHTHEWADAGLIFRTSRCGHRRVRALDRAAAAPDRGRGGRLPVTTSTGPLRRSLPCRVSRSSWRRWCERCSRPRVDRLERV